MRNSSHTPRIGSRHQTGLDNLSIYWRFAGYIGRCAVATMVLMAVVAACAGAGVTVVLGAPFSDYALSVRDRLDVKPDEVVVLVGALGAILVGFPTYVYLMGLAGYRIDE